MPKPPHVARNSALMVAASVLGCAAAGWVLSLALTACGGFGHRPTPGAGRGAYNRSTDC